MLTMIDQKPAFEIYHDPEPFELVSSAPQEILASAHPPPSPQTSRQQQRPLLGSSLASSVSRLSPSPAGSSLANVPRVVLGELPLRTTVNPFHRHQSQGYGPCGGRRLRPTTCDSRLKHETKLRSSSPPPPNASEDSSEDLDRDDEDDGCHGRQPASRIPSFKSRSTRRSTISTTHIPQNGRFVVARQSLRKTSLPSSVSGTRSGIIMKHRSPVSSRSSSENLSSSSSSSPEFSSSWSLPSSISSPDGWQSCRQLQVEEETKENLPLSMTRKHNQGRLKKPHSHYQAGVASCQNIPVISNSDYSGHHCRSRQFSLPSSSSRLAATHLTCSTRPSNATRDDRPPALEDSASRHHGPSSLLADRRAPHSSLVKSRDPPGGLNPSSSATAPPDPLEDRQLHHRNRSLPGFLMRI